LKTFKRFVRVAVLGAFAAGSLVVVAAPAGAHTITTLLLSCDSVQPSTQISSTILDGGGQGLDLTVDPTTIKGKQVTGTGIACGGALASATGNLLKSSVKLVGNGSCPALVSGTGGYTFSGKLSWTFTTATSSTVTGHAGAPHPSWNATTKLTAYVRLDNNHPDITQDDPSDVLSLLGIVTKGVAVGQIVSARAVGFNPHTNNNTTPMGLADVLACASTGTPDIDGARSFTNGTAFLGSTITDTVRVGTP
jgi:hypothetical protein